MLGRSWQMIKPFECKIKGFLTTKISPQTFQHNGWNRQKGSYFCLCYFHFNPNPNLQKHTHAHTDKKQARTKIKNKNT